MLLCFPDEESDLVWPIGSERGILGFILSTKSKERWGMKESRRLKNDMMLRLACGAYLLLCAESVLGVDVTFPQKEKGTYDLALQEVWGDTVMPQSGDRVLFKSRDGYTFTASKDLNFKSIQIQVSSGGATNVFALDQGRKIKLHSDSNGNTFNSYYSYAHTTFSGGKWEMGGVLKCAAGWKGHHSTLILTNSVDMTIQTLSAGAGAIGGMVHMTDGSKAVISHPSFFGAGTTNAFFRIDNGAQVTGVFDPSGKANSWITESNSSGCRMEVAGEGTAVYGKTTFRSHNTGSTENELVVSDGALFDFSGHVARLGEGTASSNTLVFTSNAKAYFGETTLNYEAGAYANSIEVSDGAELDLRSSEDKSGDKNLSVAGLGGSEVLVSNATLRCCKLTLGTTSTSSGNRLRLTGPDAEIVTTLDGDKTYNLFGLCGGNEVLVDDGACWNISNHFFFASYIPESGSGSNAVHVAGGAELLVNKCWIGTPHGGNRLIVSSGGQFLVSSVTSNMTGLAVHAPETAIVLSNGVVRTLGKNVKITFGDAFNYVTSTDSPRTRLAVSGTNSLIEATGSMSFKTQAIISFDVPCEGFVRAPLKSDRLSLSDDCTINVSCASFREGLARRTRLVLAETAAGVTVPDEVLARANAVLSHDGARLYVSEDERMLVLEVSRPPRGTVILLQ